MIKITRNGTRKERFFGNANNPCEQCGCIFKCDESDIDKESGTVRCPCCGTECKVSEFVDFVEINPLTEKRVDFFNFSIRTKNCLRFMNVRTVHDILQYNRDDFMRFPALWHTKSTLFFKKYLTT